MAEVTLCSSVTDFMTEGTNNRWGRVNKGRWRRLLEYFQPLTRRHHTSHKGGKKTGMWLHSIGATVTAGRDVLLGSTNILICLSVMHYSVSMSVASYEVVFRWKAKVLQKIILRHSFGIWIMETQVVVEWNVEMYLPGAVAYITAVSTGTERCCR